MIRFGPGGIPLSCKGRTQRDGLQDIHLLGLNAMEIQFLRVNTSERYATDEDEGKRPVDLEHELIIDVRRPPRYTSVYSEKVTIQEGDILYSLKSGIVSDYQELVDVGELARDLDIKLGIHTPYYMDLTGSKELAEMSINYLKWCGILAKYLRCDVIATHLGLYHDKSPKENLEEIIVKLRKVRDWYSKMGINSLIGVETSGKKTIVGSLEEVLTICRRIKGTMPVINFAHYHARSGGKLRRKEDFEELFNEISKAWKGSEYYAHFSGVEHEGGEEKKFTPIKKGDLRFEPLVEYLLENDTNITLISSSPLLEHDAMYMRVIFERIQLKHETKYVKSFEEFMQEILQKEYVSRIPIRYIPKKAIHAKIQKRVKEKVSAKSKTKKKTKKKK